MSDMCTQAARRSAAAISGLSQENQAAIGKYIASLINTAMDLAEQIAPMLIQQPTDPAA